MISEKIYSTTHALRTLLTSTDDQLPPLTVSLLDSLENEAERVAILEELAVLDCDYLLAAQGE